MLWISWVISSSWAFALSAAWGKSLGIAALGFMAAIFVLPWSVKTSTLQGMQSPVRRSTFISASAWPGLHRSRAFTCSLCGKPFEAKISEKS